MTRADRWFNRTEVRSETTDRVYVVSQHAARRHWGCSCPAWRVRRRCKHLEQLGLPGGEVPFEVKKDHAKKGFLDGYPTYDAGGGHGCRAEWRERFAARMGLDEARGALDLPADAGWDDVRRAFHLAATESLARLVGDYEAAVRAFGTAGPAGADVEAVRAARFRVEAYAADLGDQRRRLEAEAGLITGELLARIEGL